MKGFKIFFIFLVVALIAIGGLLVKRGLDSVWSYNYRDEGGNIVFVTRKFDLILPGRKWSDSNASFVAGNGVLMVRAAPGTSVAAGGHPKPVLKANERLELSFPNLTVAILKGETLEVGGTAIPLTKHRSSVTVSENGSVTVTNVPASNFPWDSIEYIGEISAKLAVQNRSQP